LFSADKAMVTETIPGSYGFKHRIIISAKISEKLSLGRTDQMLKPYQLQGKINAIFIWEQPCKLFETITYYTMRKLHNINTYQLRQMLLHTRHRSVNIINYDLFTV
jgi:hypothetical protein